MARVAVFLAGLRHRHHVVRQWQKLIDEVEQISLDLNLPETSSNSEEDLEALVIQACRKVLERKARPGSSIVMVLAICLRREVFLHSFSAGTISAPPCPCLHGSFLEEPIHLYMDDFWRCYVLLPPSKVMIRSTRKKECLVNEEPKREAGVPGMPQLARAFVYKGIDIWTKNIDHIQNNHWLHDNVVEMLLMYFKDQAHADNIYIFPPQFAIKLLCETIQRTVEFHSYNFEGILPWTYDKQSGTPCPLFRNDALLFPVCNNTHWILLCYITSQRKLYILDSSATLANKRRFKGAVDGIKRFLGDYCNMLERRNGNPLSQNDIVACELEVPQQSNGNDCGVFVIFNGKTIIENL